MRDYQTLNAKTEIYTTSLTRGEGGPTHKTKRQAKPPCQKNEMLDTPVENVDNPEKWDAEVTLPHIIENKMRKIGFSENF